ncbi:hypothetical protein EON65_18245 [archaeon]|nr:MAG: hypothetical protein EON65_18245 [archaeon]
MQICRYRAPEVLAGWSSYGYSVDMWALGCILVELINRAPLFPGSDSLKQLEKIVAILGKPEQSFINKCLKYSYRYNAYTMFIDSLMSVILIHTSFIYRRFLQALPSMPARMFKELVPNASMDALDLAERYYVFY